MRIYKHTIIWGATRSTLLRPFSLSIGALFCHTTTLFRGMCTFLRRFAHFLHTHRHFGTELVHFFDHLHTFTGRLDTFTTICTIFRGFLHTPTLHSLFFLGEITRTLHLLLLFLDHMCAHTQTHAHARTQTHAHTHTLFPRKF
jgi:hypothetical protein